MTLQHTVSVESQRVSTPPQTPHMESVSRHGSPASDSPGKAGKQDKRRLADLEDI